MSSENFHNVVSVPKIGHGNPAEAIAVEKFLREYQQAVTLITLNNFTAQFANFLHKGMSRSHKNGYHENSEDLRLSQGAQVIQVFLYVEFIFALHTMKLTGEQKRRMIWRVIQEFPLLGSVLIKFFRDFLENFAKIGIILPDTYGKKSSEEAARRTGAHLVVWNTDAHEYFSGQKLPSHLVEPHILKAYELHLSEQNRFQNRGRPIVMKSSGSGMPDDWVRQIEEQCCISGKEYSFFLPNSTIHSAKGTRLKLKTNSEAVQEKLAECYQALGIRTQWVICYPSEMVSVLAEMRVMGSSVNFISLPPRGEHEQKNLQWAVKHGLCVGILRFNKQKKILNCGAEIIEADHLSSILSDRRVREVEDLTDAVGKQGSLREYLLAA